MVHFTRRRRKVRSLLSNSIDLENLLPAAVYQNDFVEKSLKTLGGRQLCTSRELFNQLLHISRLELEAWSRSIKRAAAKDLMLDPVRACCSASWPCRSLRENLQRIGMLLGNCHLGIARAPTSHLSMPPSTAALYQSCSIRAGAFREQQGWYGSAIPLRNKLLCGLNRISLCL